jgi:hypothetical protein
MAEKFSEGEWFLHDDGRTIYAGRADEDSEGCFPWPGKAFVCEVGDRVEGLEGDDPIADANARLIVAAPAMYEAIRDQVAWIERLLQTLEHRAVHDGRGNTVNGFAFAAVPDWDLRQKLESLKQDLSLVEPT